MKKFIPAIILFILCSIPAEGQSGGDTLLYNFQLNRISSLSTSFSKQLNIFNLHSGLTYSNFGDNIFAQIKEDFTSTIIRRANNSVRDQQKLSLVAGYKITPFWDAGIYAGNNILADSRSIEINEASTSKGGVFTRIEPDDNIYFAASFGYANDRQVGEIDEGLFYGLEGNVFNYNISNFLVSSTLNLKNEDISPRKNVLRDVELSVASFLENNIINTLSVNFHEIGRDFYFQADSLTANAFGITNNLQRRTESAIRVRNNFLYKDIFENTTLSLLGNIYSRSIDRDTRYKYFASSSPSVFDTRIEELQFEVQSSLQYESRLFSSYIRAMYSERDERHIVLENEEGNPLFYDQRSEQEARKNNLSHITQLSASANYRLDYRDYIDVSFSHYKLVYDTPSEDNYDDRDELLTILRVRYVKGISPFFSAFVSAEGNISKLTYILAERSSNNNTNRVLKLQAGGYYKSTLLSSYNSFEVSANYTVYDFEDVNPNYKSYSLRQLAFFDSTTIHLDRRFRLKMEASLKETEQGDLNWGDFSINPTRRVVEQYLLPELETDVSRMVFAIGMRIFSLETFSLSSGNEKRESYYHSFGPSTRIAYNVLEHVALSLFGYYEFISSDQTSNEELASFDFRLNWIF